MSAEENQVWDLYIQDKGIRPKNAAQLMKWSKAHDNAANLSFSAAKQVFANRSKEPVEEKTPPDAADRPKVDMTAEKEELKEYISECKEELVSLQNRDLSMEDDYYEGLEGLETQFDELEAQLKKEKATLKGKVLRSTTINFTAEEIARIVAEAPVKKIKLTTRASSV